MECSDGVWCGCSDLRREAAGQDGVKAKWQGRGEMAPPAAPLSTRLHSACQLHPPPARFCSDLRRNLELSKQTEQELAKRNNVYQKTIKSLVRGFAEGPGGRGSRLRAQAMLRLQPTNTLNLLNLGLVCRS